MTTLSDRLRAGAMTLRATTLGATLENPTDGSNDTTMPSTANRVKEVMPRWSRSRKRIVPGASFLERRRGVTRRGCRRAGVDHLAHVHCQHEDSAKSWQPVQIRPAPLTSAPARTAPIRVCASQRGGGFWPCGIKETQPEATASWQLQVRVLPGPFSSLHPWRTPQGGIRARARKRFVCQCINRLKHWRGCRIPMGKPRYIDDRKPGVNRTRKRDRHVVTARRDGQFTPAPTRDDPFTCYVSRGGGFN